MGEVGQGGEERQEEDVDGRGNHSRRFGSGGAAGRGVSGAQRRIATKMIQTTSFASVGLRRRCASPSTPV